MYLEEGNYGGASSGEVQEVGRSRAIRTAGKVGGRDEERGPRVSGVMWL